MSPGYANLATIVLAALSLAGVTLNLPDGSPLTAEGLGAALGMIGVVVSAVIGLAKMWVSKTPVPRPPGEVVEPETLRVLSRDAGLWREELVIRARTGRLYEPVERDPSYDVAARASASPVAPDPAQGRGVGRPKPFLVLCGLLSALAGLSACSQKSLTMTGGDTPSVTITAASLFSDDSSGFSCTTTADGGSKVSLQGEANPNADSLALFAQALQLGAALANPAGPAAQALRSAPRAGSSLTACTPFPYPLASKTDLASLGPPLQASEPPPAGHGGDFDPEDETP